MGGTMSDFGKNALVVPEYNGQVIVVQEPSIQSSLSRLRNKRTSKPKFRQGLKDCGFYLTQFVVDNLIQTKEKTVETPLGFSTTYVPDGKFYIIQILRAGGPFIEGAVESLYYLGLHRKIGVVDAIRLGESGNILNVETCKFNLEAQISTWKVKGIQKDAIILCYDPMLATGCSLIKTMDRLTKIRNFSLDRFINVNLVAAPYGIEEVLSRYPRARIVTAAIDKDGPYKGLNDRGYIVPGLGDAGDRSH